MPKFLERKLERRYGAGSPIVYATLNKLGYMHGNKETAKGRRAAHAHALKTALHRRAKR